MDGTDGEDLARNFSVFSPAVDETSTVILGAGIVGCATAYYLSQNPDVRPDTIHLVEASPELFASASGKGAGFCAPDWYGPSTAPLGELSFRLHQELADQHDGSKNWGYSRSTGTSLAEGEGSDEDLLNGASRANLAGKHEFAGNDSGPAWLTRRNGDKLELLSEDKGVAQVDPIRLCQFLLRQCIRKGIRLHQPATPLRLQRDLHNQLSGLRLHHITSGADFKIPCTRLVIACGAWSSRVFDTLFPSSSVNLGISHYAGYSLVVRSPRWTEEHEAQGKGCHALFTSMRGGVSAEIFSRVGGEIYVAGLNDAELPLPKLATDAKVEKGKTEVLGLAAQRLLGSEGGGNAGDLEVVREGLCFRPVTARGTPVIGRIADEELGILGTKSGREGGVFIAAGHGPWGISLGLGTGLVVSEMLEGKEESVDVSGLGV